MSDIDGRNLTALLTEVETVEGVFVLDAATQVLHLRHEGAEKLVHVSLKDRAITLTLPLPTP